MLRGITFNCDPSGLGGLAPERFFQRFDDLVHGVREWAFVRVAVTFDGGGSRLTAVVADDWRADEPRLPEYGRRLGELARQALPRAV
jgi:hypothetical protein